MDKEIGRVCLAVCVHLGKSERLGGRAGGRSGGLGGCTGVRAVIGK